ncbi:MAG: hypothetical protein ACOYKZ_04215 [Chlamydiia bacterium]
MSTTPLRRLLDPTVVFAATKLEQERTLSEEDINLIKDSTGITNHEEILIYVALAYAQLLRKRAEESQNRAPYEKAMRSLERTFRLTPDKTHRLLSKFVPQAILLSDQRPGEVDQRMKKVWESVVIYQRDVIADTVERMASLLPMDIFSRRNTPRSQLEHRTALRVLKQRNIPGRIENTQPLSPRSWDRIEADMHAEVRKLRDSISELAAVGSLEDPLNTAYEDFLREVARLQNMLNAESILNPTSRTATGTSSLQKLTGITAPKAMMNPHLKTQDTASRQMATQLKRKVCWTAVGATVAALVVGAAILIFGLGPSAPLIAIAVIATLGFLFLTTWLWRREQSAAQLLEQLGATATQMASAMELELNRIKKAAELYIQRNPTKPKERVRAAEELFLSTARIGLLWPVTNLEPRRRLDDRETPSHLKVRPQREEVLHLQDHPDAIKGNYMLPPDAGQ